MNNIAAKPIPYTTAGRIIGVEYLQNLPVLIGLCYALSAANWPIRLGVALLGAVGSALIIVQSEGLKLGKPTEHRERLSDAAMNAALFFAGAALYLAYDALIRQRFTSPLEIDVLFGAILGGAVGLAQGVLVADRRLSTSAFAHSIALSVTVAMTLLLIGSLRQTWLPLPMAAFLCLPMSLIIVRLDYWHLIRA